VGRRLRYVAVAHESGGAVRAADDLAGIDAAVWRARIHALGLAAVAVLGGVALLHLFFWLTHRRPLRDLRRMAGSIAEGRLDVRLPQAAADDLSRIARSINEIAGQLRQRLLEVTRDKEQLGAVLEGMVEGVLVIDARGRVLLANSRLRELFDTTGEIVGRPLLEGVRNADLESILDEAARTGETVARTLSIPGPSLRRLQVQAARFPKEGEPVGTVARRSPPSAASRRRCSRAPCYRPRTRSPTWRSSTATPSGSRTSSRTCWSSRPSRAAR